MKLNVVIFCLIFSNFSIIGKSEEDEWPAEKRVVRSTVEEYVGEKIKEGIAKILPQIMEEMRGDIKAEVLAETNINIETKVQTEVESKVAKIEENIHGKVEDLQENFKTETNANIESKIRPFKSDINSIESKVTKIEGTVQDLEDSNAKSVVFNAIRNTGNHFKGDITYDVVPTNIGNALNADTGVFRAPFDATYEFNFVGYMPNSETIWIQFFKNGGVETPNWIFHDEGGKVSQTLSYQWMMELKAGDELKLSVVQGNLYAASRNPVVFTGQLVGLTN